MNILVNFADEKYKQVRSINSWTGIHVAGMDLVKEYTPEDIDSSFKNDNVNIFIIKIGDYCLPIFDLRLFSYILSSAIRYTARGPICLKLIFSHFAPGLKKILLSNQINIYTKTPGSYPAGHPVKKYLFFNSTKCKSCNKVFL